MQYREHLGTSPARSKTTAMRLTDAPNWTFGPARLLRCATKAGAHCGLPQYEFNIYYRNIKIASCNVHLHHNQTAVSVGTTTHFYTENVPEAAIEPPADESISPPEEQL